MRDTSTAPKPSTEAPVTDEIVDAIAEEAVVDRRSVLRRLAGLDVRGAAGRRLDRVLAQRCIVPMRGE